MIENYTGGKNMSLLINNFYKNVEKYNVNV